MQQQIYFKLIKALAIMVVCVSSINNASAADGVCSNPGVANVAGLGEPPFLSYGVDTNLLLMIDNSGSMLDMAYTKPDLKENDGKKVTKYSCFDDTFKQTDPVNPDNTKTCVPKDENNTEEPLCYAGNFQTLTPEDTLTTEVWYKWQDGLPGWDSTTTYEEGSSLVNENGVVYRAMVVKPESVPSSDSNIYDDKNVTWEPLFRPYWRPNTFYREFSFVVSPSSGNLFYNSGDVTSGSGEGPSPLTPPSPEYDKNVDGAEKWIPVETWSNGTYDSGVYVEWKNTLYRSTSSGDSTGDSPLNDKGVAWEVVDPLAWKPKTTYLLGEYVTFRGILYKALLLTHTSADVASLYEDSYEGATTPAWKRVDEGAYEKLSDPSLGQQVCTGAAEGKANAKVYSSSDLCVTIDEPTTGPHRVLAFAATGNMLNWLTESKFDIQKSILTGGKYNSADQLLIGESRGCSGSRFVKEVPVNSGTKKLTMAVRGSRSEGIALRKDRIDSYDDTTRLEILGVSANGYNIGDCQDAVTKILQLDKTLGAQQAISDCLGSPNNDTNKERVALNHALQYCSLVNRQLQSVVNDCSDLYASKPPSEFSSPFGLAYNCYGIFDDGTPHGDRKGFVGRCWQAKTTSGVSCDPKSIPNDPDTDVCPDKNGKDVYPCIFDYTVSYIEEGTTKEITYKIANFKEGNAFITKNCTGLDLCTKDNAPPFNVDSEFGLYCDPTQSPYNTTPADDETSINWSSEVDGDPDTTPPDECTMEVDSSLKNKIETCAFECISTAMDDYCKSMTTTEVIDPTTQISASVDENTEQDPVGDEDPLAGINVPALLLDSGVLGQLGVDVPLKVMKGFIKQTTPPESVLQEKADILRIGAMAFNKVGSMSECGPDNFDDNIEQYCLNSDQDGARVIAPIRLGSWMVDEKTPALDDDVTHVDEVADAINLVQANAWTPLAEAMYNAIGYYTQDNSKRINPNGSPGRLQTYDFQTDEDVFAPREENKYYPPGSYVHEVVDVDGEERDVLYHTALGGTSKGTSDTIVNDDVDWEEVGKFGGKWSNGTKYEAKQIVSYYDKLYITEKGGTAKIKQGASEVPGWLQIYDGGVEWEPLLDPVVYSCQENHLLMITEGVSTADINEAVATFVSGMMPADSAVEEQGECVSLKGSTYLDDLTFFGNKSTSEVLYPLGNSQIPLSDPPFDLEDKQPLTSHFFVSGSLSSVGDGECKPEKLIENAASQGGTGEPIGGEDPAEQKRALEVFFNELRQRASAGSAASVISSARSGEGAIYQAIFWPERKRNHETKIDPVTNEPVEYKITWVGDVHGLFIDDKGYMYEDSNGNRLLDPSEDLDGDGHFDCGEFTATITNTTVSPGSDKNGDTKIDLRNESDVDFDIDGHFDLVCEDVNNNGVWDVKDSNNNDLDKRVIVYFDDTDKRSKACYDQSIVDSLGDSCNNWKELDEVAFLWSANNELSKLDLATLDLNRSDFISPDKQRNIFTWNDVNRNGVVDDGEVVPFEEGNFDTLFEEFNTGSAAEVNKVVNWIRGVEDLDGFRSRKFMLNEGTGTREITWRLGDIINSTPQTVTGPAEAYHLLYNDASYVPFVSKYKPRRHVVYFGGNDGMLHAVNAGFYSESEKKFCLTKLDADTGKCPVSESGPALGAELWAYIPYNLHPHLKCLTSPTYEGQNHKYYVDLRPRVFDVQIFNADDNHPNGWGTILVGGMRFGGAPQTVTYPDGKTYPFISSYFILDITNPENPPVLLGELTKGYATSDLGETSDLGFSTVVPTLAIAKTVDNPKTPGNEYSNAWYLVLGSGPRGPNALKGESNQKAKLSVMYLGGTDADGIADKNGLVGDGNKPVRPFRVYEASSTPVISQTFILEPTAAPTKYGFVSDPITVDFDINPTDAEEYASDAIYFGTVEAANNEGTVWQGGGGHLYRLVMEPSGHTIRGGTSSSLLGSWGVKPLIDLSVGNAAGTIQPITAAPSVGMDDDGKYWIYFGTGRFFDVDDKRDSTQQSFYGIREPMDDDTSTKLNWDPVTVTNLLRVDQFDVQLSDKSSTALVSCNDPVSGCPITVSNDFHLDDLETHIAKYTNGWYKHFAPYENRERNLGQATLLGGLVTFTTYQPFSDVCKAEGESYLYGVYYKTGTSWHENVFGDYGLSTIMDKTYVKNKLSLGRGLSITPSLFTGSGEDGAKAFVQTSTGAILEIKQDNLPIDNYKTGRESWKEFER